MKELWFGGWQNFYDVSWPVRFLIELFIYVLIVAIVVKLLTHFLPLKKWGVIGCALTIKESVYLIGRNRNWAVELDNKVTEWGENALKDTGKRKNTKRMLVIFLMLIVLYFFAVFMDLPVSKNFEKESLAGVANIKAFFQQVENKLSKGYKKYPPLLKKKETIYIQLNASGKKDAKIRHKPSLKGKIICKMKSKSKIIYQNKLEYDGKRYWLKVYLPDDKIEGWLNGKLIVKKQLKKFVDEAGR